MYYRNNTSTPISDNGDSESYVENAALIDGIHTALKTAVPPDEQGRQKANVYVDGNKIIARSPSSDDTYDMYGNPSTLIADLNRPFALLDQNKSPMVAVSVNMDAYRSLRRELLKKIVDEA